MACIHCQPVTVLKGNSIDLTDEEFHFLNYSLKALEWKYMRQTNFFMRKENQVKGAVETLLWDLAMTKRLQGKLANRFTIWQHTFDFEP